VTSPIPFKSLLILLAIFYFSILSRMVFAPLLPVIEVEFDLSHGTAGSLFLFIAIGYCAGLLGSGFVSSRLNHRRTIFLSAIALGGTMLAVSRSASVSSMRPGLFLVGCSAGFYFPSGVATLTNLISQEHWGKTLAIHEMAPNLAFLTGPLLVEGILKFAPWRSIPIVLGGSSILVGILFLRLGPKEKLRGEPPNLRAMQRIFSNPFLLVMTAVFALSVGAESGVYAMLPLFLVHEIGFDREWGNTLVGMSRLSGFLILFFSGIAADRIGHKRAMVLFLAILGTLTFLLGALRGPVVTPILIILQATSLPCFFPAALATISHVFPSELRSLGVALIGLVAIFFGVGAIPPAIGYLAEVSSFSLGFSLLGVFLLAMLPLVITLPTDR
jgi:NNP family nitrate/nitrite transporter-like MFS transporter